MMAADYRHIGGRENRLGRHYSRFSPFWPTPALSGQSLALRKLCDAGSNRRSQVSATSRSDFLAGKLIFLGHEPRSRPTRRLVRLSCCVPRLAILASESSLFSGKTTAVLRSFSEPAVVHQSRRFPRSRPDAGLARTHASGYAPY